MVGDGVVRCLWGRKYKIFRTCVGRVEQSCNCGGRVLVEEGRAGIARRALDVSINAIAVAAEY